jgi:hypothetical protein
MSKWDLMKCQLRKKHLTKWQVKNGIRLNSVLTKCHWLIRQLTEWYLEKLTKWHVGKISLNKMTVDNWHVYKMSLNKGQLTKWHIDKMAHWQNCKLTKKYADKMSCIKMVADKMQLTKWHNYKMPFAKMARWQNVTAPRNSLSGFASKNCLNLREEEEIWCFS